MASHSANASLNQELRNAVRSLHRVVPAVSPTSISADDALGLVNLLAEAERVAASGIARLSPRVTETGVYAKAGHPSGHDWLAAVAGSSAGAARSRLAAAERAAREPGLTEPLRNGTLSVPELKVLSDAAANAPESLGELVSLAEGPASHQELYDAAERAKCVARSKESARLRRARVHRARHLTWYQDQGGGIRGEFLCDEVGWAKVASRLEAAAKKRWRDSGGGTDAESLAAHRVDALIDLVAGSQNQGTESSHPHALVLLDAAALRRGRLIKGDTCEIDGVGPISLEAATELLDDASVQFIVKSGRDIASVTSATRTPPQRTAMALIARDRTCVVPGCGRRLGLEGDHCDVDYSDDGPTTLANMVRLCPAHHNMKTYGGWKIMGEPGNWRWVSPDKPPTGGRIARTRRLTAAKATAAKARAKADRNQPRRT